MGETDMFRKTLFAIAGLIVGFIGGIIVSEVIAITAYLTLGQSAWLKGLKYLPWILSILCAVAAYIWVPAKKQSRRAT
jgi:multisubunit Na+/H+ antiporter MnhE subunit